MIEPKITLKVDLTWQEAKAVINVLEISNRAFSAEAIGTSLRHRAIVSIEKEMDAIRDLLSDTCCVYN